MHMYMNVDINDMTWRFSCEEEMALQGSACKNDCDESKPPKKTPDKCAGFCFVVDFVVLLVCCGFSPQNSNQEVSKEIFDLHLMHVQLKIPEYPTAKKISSLLRSRTLTFVLFRDFPWKRMFLEGFTPLRV